MMRDTPTTFMDCAAVFKSGNTQSGVYTLTLPNTTTEVKVQLACLSYLKDNFTLIQPTLARPCKYNNAHLYTLLQSIVFEGC